MACESINCDDVIDVKTDGPSHGALNLDLSRIIPQPNKETVEALQRLSRLPKVQIDLKSMPARRVAAVLVLLHVNDEGELSVTLTTRSSRMRSHPGDTALPGGRVEDSDESVVMAALRESNEEIGLPLSDMNQYGFLGILNPFVSRNLLVVYPVVYVLLSPAKELIQSLVANEDEVANIFHWPLRDMIRLKAGEPLDPIDGHCVYSYRDVQWMNSKPYRWHSFSHGTMPSPITGLTADILIHVASFAFGLQDQLCDSIKAPAQEEWPVLVTWALSGVGGKTGDDHSLIRRAAPLEK